MEALGFDPEDYEAGAFEVWPENWPAVQMFLRLGTQWHVGMNGPTGLIYAALYPLLDRATTSPDEWNQLFDDVQHLERAALQQLAKKD